MINPIINNENYFYKTTTPLNARGCSYASLAKNISFCGRESYFTGYLERIKYTSKHKIAFLKMEKQLLGKNTLGSYLHDLDKLIMYIVGFPKKLAHNIHVATAPHHVRNGKIKKPLQAIIDWECARFTKPDKPLNAREFYESYFVKKKNMRLPEIEEGFKKLGL
jgi:hypothetical protein